MSCTYNIRPGNIYYQNMVNRIKSMLNMNYPIGVFIADSGNACATMYKLSPWDYNRPIITYDPKFIAQLNRISPWAVRAVFAHEVAHHYNGDLQGNYLAGRSGNNINYKSHVQELDADYVAGWVLACEGAPLNQTTLLYHMIALPDTYTHPATHKRIAAATQGWYDARRSLAA